MQANCRKSRPQPAARQGLTGTGRRGAVLVETAITLPIVVLMLLGFIELARLEMIRETCSTAAFEAARQGIVPGSTTQDVKDTGEGVLRAIGVQGTEVDVSPGWITDETSKITVTVRVPMAKNLWLSSSMFKVQQIVSTYTLERELLDDLVVDEY